MENNNNVVLFSKAVAYAAKKHAAQTRREGSPYIYHPLAVATMVRNMGFGIDYQIAAVLHDTLEDTDATEEELRRIFGNEVTDAVVLLTRKPGEDEEEYVSSILQNHIAAVVKNADKIHNLREVVCVGIPGSKRTEAEAQHAVRYLNKAIKYYMNRFSQALNDAIDFTRTKLHDWTVPDFTASVPAYTKEKMTLFMDQEVDPKLQEELPDFSLPCEKIQFIELDFSDICDPILYCFYDLSLIHYYFSFRSFMILINLFPEVYFVQNYSAAASAPPSAFASEIAASVLTNLPTGDWMLPMNLATRTSLDGMLAIFWIPS